MRIFSIYYTHKPGGFCKRLYRLLSSLAAEGHTVYYFALDNPPDALSSEVIFKRIPFVMDARSGTLFWLLFTLWAPLYLAWNALQLKPERIAVFGAYYGFIGQLARTVSKAKLILFIRSLVFEINRITEKPLILQKLSNVLERIGMRRADRLVAMSNTMAVSLREFIAREREILILPNDVPPLPSKPTELPPTLLELVKEQKSRGKILVLISGVFDARKNLQFVLDTLALLSENSPQHPFTLLVAGEGSYLSQAKTFVSTHPGLSVHFLGWLPTLDALYPHIALVLHPALHEGMPNSVLEAWAHQVPALLAATPELRELAPCEQLWISPFTSQHLKKMLSHLASEPGLLEELKIATERCAAPLRFDWNHQAVVLITSN